MKLDPDAPREWVRKGFLVTHRDGHEAVMKNDEEHAKLYAVQNHALSVEPLFARRQTKDYTPL